METLRDAIFIQNLPKDVTRDQIYDAFSKVGPIKVILEPYTHYRNVLVYCSSLRQMIDRAARKSGFTKIGILVKVMAEPP